MSSGEPSTITCKQEKLLCSPLSSANLAASSAPIKEDVHENAFKGKAASIQRIPGCGHLVPLVQPDIVADAILNTFASLATLLTTKSRL